jgi:hypothetical protein
MVAMHCVVPPILNVTLPAGEPPPGADTATVALKVTVAPNVLDVGATCTAVVVDAWITVRVVNVEDDWKLGDPWYDAVTVSVPTGARAEVQLPDPLVSVAVHMVVALMAKVTCPGGAPAADMTVASNWTLCPKVLEFGTSWMVVDVGANETEIEVVAVEPLNPQEGVGEVEQLPLLFHAPL